MWTWFGQSDELWWRYGSGSKRFARHVLGTICQVSRTLHLIGGNMRALLWKRKKTRTAKHGSRREYFLSLWRKLLYLWTCRRGSIVYGPITIIIMCSFLCHFSFRAQGPIVHPQLNGLLSVVIASTRLLLWKYQKMSKVGRLASRFSGVQSSSQEQSSWANYNRERGVCTVSVNQRTTTEKKQDEEKCGPF